MNNSSSDSRPSGEVVLFQSEDGQSKIQVRLESQTVWLPLRLIAELFQVSVPTVNEHLANLYQEGEIASEATIRKFRIVQIEGKREVGRILPKANCRWISVQL